MPAILSLPSLTTSTGNIVFPVVDVNVNPNVTKKATLSQIKDYIGATVIAPQGYTGSGGTNGYVGSAGSGYIGSQGTQGYTGSTGNMGYTGSVGVTGYIGSASTASGYVGSVGYTGSIGAPILIAGSTSTFSALPIPYSGFPGNLYITIDDGFGNVWDGGTWTSLGSPVQGPTGYSGSIGYSGSQGNTGYAGSIGYVGSVGAASTVPGYVGSIGYTGSIGYVGSQGTFDGTTDADIVTFSTSTSTSAITGAIVSYGGLGVGGDLNVNGYAKSFSQFILPVYSTSTLAVLSTATGGVVFLENAPGGSQPVYYDGTGWFTFDGRVQVL